MLLQNPLLSTHFLTSQDQILCRHVARVPSFFLPPSFRDSCASNDWFTNIFACAPSISISPPYVLETFPLGSRKKEEYNRNAGGRGYAMNNGGISYTRQICYSKEYLLLLFSFFFLSFFLFSFHF